MADGQLDDFDRAYQGALTHNGLQDSDPDLFARGEKIIRFGLKIDKVITAAEEDGLHTSDISRMLIKMALEIEEDNV